MQPQELKRGDVVQISPSKTDDFFAGCFMLVTEPRAWGAQGFVAIPGKRGEAPGAAYTRVQYEDIELVGAAPWVPEE